MHWIYHTIQAALLGWGYWAVFAGLLGEDAGLPLPGETVLVFASFLAHKDGRLQLQWVILVGIAACIAGDNLGFLVGRRIGTRLVKWIRKIFRLDDEDIAVAKAQVRRHGAATIFWARFVFGLRTVAGPLAGALGMAWKEFSIFNALGAAAWVTTMALTGYLFANEFNNLLEYLEKASWAVAIGYLALGYYLWRRKKRRFLARHPRPASSSSK